ncbi:MAG: hypothetical protein JNK48_02215 [Bryobacterales bacterium]|nr:hypothetical protein [Bryobacterales bacterium]
MAGMLIAGKSPRYFLPGAYVQYLRLAGTAHAQAAREIGKDFEKLALVILDRAHIAAPPAGF